MRARDKLAEIISDAENCTDEEGSWALPEDVADAIVAAGWRPPMRDICTPTDMKTLISGALVRDREGLFRVLSEPDAVDFENHGPFRVVWEPDGEA